MSDDAKAAVLRELPALSATHGWTRATLAMAMRRAGQDPVLAASMFPAGPVGAIADWIAQTDEAMIEAAGDLSGVRIPQRIRRLVATRLELAAPHKPALRRALALQSLPWNVGSALATGARTADAIWHAAGDSSADFSWYTRRATLAAIYGATLAYWLRDDDPDPAPALAFLDRRLADLARLQRARPSRR